MYFGWNSDQSDRNECVKKFKRNDSFLILCLIRTLQYVSHHNLIVVSFFFILLPYCQWLQSECALGSALASISRLTRNQCKNCSVSFSVDLKKKKNYIYVTWWLTIWKQMNERAKYVIRNELLLLTSKTTHNQFRWICVFLIPKIAATHSNIWSCWLSIFRFAVPVFFVCNKQNFIVSLLIWDCISNRFSL